MRALPRTMASLLAAIGISSSPRLALATEQPVGVGPIEYSGEFPTYFQRDIDQTLIDALEGAHEVVIELRVHSCTRLDCLRAPAARANVEIVIMPRVRKNDRDYRVELTAYAIDDAQVLAEVVLECSVCGQQELLDAIPAKVVELQAEIVEGLAARVIPARLAIDGTPSGAALTLDGSEIGVGPIALEVSIGPHELEIAAAGHAAQAHRWVAVTGVEERVTYELTPVSPTRGGSRGTQIGGWTTMAIGVAGVGTGAALIILDGRAHGPTCEPELVDENGGCPNVYTTATAGYIALGLGIAVLAVGAGLLIHHHRHAPKRSLVRATAGGLSVRF
ncbi:MAG: PEGA domain-containing protein [Deltaproteobacteria bacterium]|nr:PEGA domain-containing protein [Deltaproteobacteria bacterium]